MGLSRPRYVARAEAGKGWRIFNRKTKRYWGNWFKSFPGKMLDELNSNKDPEVLRQLGKEMKT